MTDRIQVINRSGATLVECESSHAPDRGDQIVIRKVIYTVIGRSYVVDQPDMASRNRDIVCYLTVEMTGEVR